MNQNRRAIDDLNRAIELDPNMATAYLNRGAAYNSLGQYERAIDDLARAIKLDTKNAGAHTNIGLAYFMVNQYDHSIESLSEAVRLAPRNAIVLLNRGNVYARLGFRDQAVQDYSAAEQTDPRLIASYGGSARLLEEMGRQTLAIRDERIGTRPDSGELDNRYESGNAKRARGDWQGAIAEFDRVIAADPNRAEAYLARGWAKFCGGEVGAEHDARAYLKLKGYRERTSSYMVLLGYLSAKRAGKEEDAQAFLDQAKHRDPRRRLAPAGPPPLPSRDLADFTPERGEERDPGDRGPRVPRPRHAEPRGSQGRDRTSRLGPRPWCLPVDRDRRGKGHAGEDRPGSGDREESRGCEGRSGRSHALRVFLAGRSPGRDLGAGLQSTLKEVSLGARTSTIASPLEILAGPLQVSGLSVQLTQSCIEQVIVLQRWVVREIPDFSDGDLRSLHASEDDRPIEPVNR